MAALKNEVARYFAERNLAFRLPVNDKITSVDNSHASELVDIHTDRIRAPNRVRGELLVPVAEEVMKISSTDASSQVIVKKSKTDYRLMASRMQAWRAKQKVLSASLDEGKESY
ncbi:unnamed protein product [Aphanomyces euteiches]